MDLENQVASSSMRQYLEEVGSYLRTSQVKRSEENPEDTQSNLFHFDDKLSRSGLEFRDDNSMRHNFLQVSSCNNSNMGEQSEKSKREESKNRTKESVSGVEEAKSNVADALTDKDPVIEEENVDISFKKPTSGPRGGEMLSNKERARRARQRKKKYYEDLENRVEYLEQRNQELMKEVDLYKSRIAQMKAEETRSGASENSTSLETKMFDSVDDFLKDFDGEAQDILDCLQDVVSKYGPFGTEKMKVLEKSFDVFLENILSGANVKLYFYVSEKPLPVKYKEFESYAKLKKYQKYEEFPDEFIREYLDARTSGLNSRENFYHYNKNKIPLYLKIKRRLKTGLSKLFDAKDEIYRCLMQIDLMLNLAPGSITKKEDLTVRLKELKYSNFMISYKEALDIKEEEAEIEEKIKLPNPKVYSNLLKYAEEHGRAEKAPKEFKSTYKYRKLHFDN